VDTKSIMLPGVVRSIGAQRLPVRDSPVAFESVVDCRTLQSRSQFSRVDLGKDRRIATSPADRQPSVTSRTASKRNSLVYLLYGTFSILTPPLMGYHKLGCPFFLTYPMILDFWVYRRSSDVSPKKLYCARVSSRQKSESMSFYESIQLLIGNMNRRRIQECRHVVPSW